MLHFCLNLGTIPVTQLTISEFREVLSILQLYAENMLIWNVSCINQKFSFSDQWFTTLQHHRRWNEWKKCHSNNKNINEISTDAGDTKSSTATIFRQLTMLLSQPIPNYTATMAIILWQPHSCQISPKRQVDVNNFSRVVSQPSSK